MSCLELYLLGPLRIQRDGEPIKVGTRKAIAIAVKNDRVARRYSALDWRLRGG